MSYAILPEQTLSTPRSPERSLMAAVLQAAVDDLKKPRPKAAAAITYLTSLDRTWPYSCANICAVLGIAQDAMVRELLG